MFALKSPQALPSARTSGRAAGAPRGAVATAALPEAVAIADRRALLLGGLAASMLSAQPALAYTKPTSALCVLQDDNDSADACRQAEITKDFNAGGQQEGYNNAKSTSKTGALVSGVPVSKLDTKYVKSSEELIGLIERYCTLDTYSKERITVAKQLKGEANTWVATYARGGSARSESARKLYIAADGVAGFLASNGLAPYPRAKVEATLTATSLAKNYLAEGK